MFVVVIREAILAQASGCDDSYVYPPKYSFVSSVIRKLCSMHSSANRTNTTEASMLVLLDFRYCCRLYSTNIVCEHISDIFKTNRMSEAATEASTCLASAQCVQNINEESMILLYLLLFSHCVYLCMDKLQ